MMYMKASFGVLCAALEAARLRAIVQLNSDLAILDQEYNKLSDHVAQGERDSHNQLYPD